MLPNTDLAGQLVASLLDLGNTDACLTACKESPACQFAVVDAFADTPTITGCQLRAQLNNGTSGVTAADVMSQVAAPN
jgi:hypothetical protein